MSKVVSFFHDEDGAVTVDWVILTAGILVFAVVVGSTMSEPVNSAASGISDTVNTAG